MSSTISRIGKYELRHVLARTPTSTVHDGWDCDLERRVAIKTVAITGSDHASRPLSSDGTHSDSIRRGSLRGLGAATLADDSASSSTDESLDSLTRFRRGARAAGKLVHPHIAGVYDYGETHDRAYIVMEFINGPTLKELFERNQRFDTGEIVNILSSILEALQYSHDHGVVHRDIKPANVMFTSDMRIKLTDFGIARLEDSDVTQTGTIMGTPAYMSPEQFLGEKVDFRSDLYSTGVILYQMLTGERPYEGSLATIMHKVLYTSPPPPSRISSVNSNFDDVVACAMAKKREQRFASATAFIAALRAAGSDDAEALATVIGRAPPVAERGLQVRPGGGRLTGSATARGGAAARPPAGTRHPGRGPQEGQPGSRKLVLIASGIAGLLLAGGTAAWLLRENPTPSSEVASIDRNPQEPTSQGSAGQGSGGQGSGGQGSAGLGTGGLGTGGLGTGGLGTGGLGAQGSASGAGQGRAGQGSTASPPTAPGPAIPGSATPGSGAPGPGGQGSTSQVSTQDLRAPAAPSAQGQGGAPQPPLATPFPTLPPPGAMSPAPTPPVAGGSEATAPPLFGSPDPTRTVPPADFTRPFAGDPAPNPLPVPPIPGSPPATPGTPVPSFPPQDAPPNTARRPPPTAERKAEPDRRSVEPQPRGQDRPAPGGPAPQGGLTNEGGSTLPPWLRRDQNGGLRADLAPGTRPDPSQGTRPDPSKPDTPQGPGGAARPPQAEGPIAGADIPTTSMNGAVGLICQSLTTESAQNLGLDSPQGMIVTGVTSGSAAFQAGIRVKDVILRINGEPTRNLSGIGRLGGQVVPVELLRQGKRQVVQLQLAGR